MWVSATSYPLAVDLTGNRAYIPDSAATVLEQRMRMADGYSHEGTTKKVFLSQIPAHVVLVFIIAKHYFEHVAYSLCFRLENIMKKKLLSTMLAATLSFTMLAGCGSSDSGKENAGSNEASQSASEETSSETEGNEAETAEDETKTSSDLVVPEYDLPTQDLAGNDIVVPEEIDAIVSMSPSSTRLLVDLGLADYIVACDTYSFEYYGADLTADIPQYDMMAPDQEAIVALNPDIVFTTGMSYATGTDVYASVREAGICVADIPSAASLAEIGESITFIGACTGTYEEAEIIVEEMNATIEEIAELAATIDEADKKTVLYETNTPTPDYPTIYSAGSGTYIAEMIEAVGAINATADQEGWASLTEEDAIAVNPDVIISTDMYTPDAVDTHLALSGWENVTAVVNGDVYLMELSNEINQPNQHVVSAMVEMAKYIYPEVFADLEDPFAVVTR